MPALFTNEQGRVTMIHYLPELLEQERIDEITLTVDVLPDTPVTDYDEEAILYVIGGEAVYQIEPRELSDTELEEYSMRVAAQIAVTERVRSNGLGNNTINCLSRIFPRWRPNKLVEVGEVYRWDGTLVEVIQEHTTQADWQPGDTPALWKVHRQEGTVTEWVQPQGAHDAYMAGERVSHNGQTWENTHGDGNVWEPGVFGWTVVAG